MKQIGQMITNVKLMSDSAVFLAAQFGFNALNYVFVVIMGRLLDLSDFGVLTLVGSWILVLSIFNSALSQTTSRFVAIYDGKAKLLGVKKTTLRLMLGLTVLALAMFGLSSSWLVNFFQLDSAKLILAFLPVTGLMFGLGWFKAVMAGKRSFKKLAGLMLTEGVVKILSGVGLVMLGWGVFGAIAAYWVSMAAVLLLAAWMNRDFWRIKVIGKSTSFGSKEINQFSGLALFVSAGLIFLSIADVVVAKHFLTPQMAGTYALLSIFGRIVLFGVSAITSVTWSHAANNLENKAKLRQVLLTGWVLVLGYVGLLVGGLSLMPELVGVVLLGTKTELVSEYLPVYIQAMGGVGLIWYWTQIKLVQKEKKSGIPAMLAVLFLIGWSYLSHGDIGLITRGFRWASLLGLGFILLLNLWGEISWSLGDMIGLTRMSLDLDSGRKKNILILNWRDTKHAWAGGAEKYIHELAKRWVEQGNKVVLFCGHDRKTQRQEVVDGVQVVRAGGFFGVYVWAMVYYVFRFVGKFDVVIDVENGVPFFSPIYSRKPKLLLIHHLHQEVFRRHLPRPLAYVAMKLEKDLMPWFYKKVKMVTISKSSQDEILKAGLGANAAEVIYCGIETDKFKPGERWQNPLVVYVGRLKAYKSVPTLLSAVKLLEGRVEDLEVVIVGDGEERANWKLFADKIGVGNKVRFVGHVSEEEKVAWYQKAWVVVNPSFMEGFGITSLEANACGTPMIGADVPGLRDSIRDGQTGYLFEYGNSNELAKKIERVIKRPRTRMRLSRRALVYSQEFDWDVSAEAFLKLAKKEISLAKRKKRRNEDSWRGAMSNLISSLWRLPTPISKLMSK